MMLAFQNLHQLVFNISQVTSAVSSGSVRVTSTSVVKKPEIDVFCSESFLHTLKIFQQSESGKVFNNLPNLKFGPRFEDIQWIYYKNVNFKFTGQKTVKENDFYISCDKKLLKNFSHRREISELTEIITNKINGMPRNALAELEAHLTTGSTWGDTFVSRNSFEENKKFSPSLSHSDLLQFNRTSPVFNSLVGVVTSYSNTKNFNSIQKRGFKTKRAIELEEKSGKGLLSKYFRNIPQSNVGKIVQTDADGKPLESPILSKMLNDSSLSSDEKLKLKVSFAEGYMVAANDMKKNSSDTILSKVFSFSKKLGVFLLIAFALAFFPFGGKKVMFPFNFGTRGGEINPESVGVTFSDVKGVEEVKEELQEIVEFLKNPGKFSNLGGKLPRGVLLVGPPGTGKTLLARAVAGEANVPFFHASGSEFDEIFVGEGARRVRNLFRSAKAKAPAIIFIDEIDCVGSKRKSTMLHPYANQTINQLLSEMDGFSKNEGVIVLGATNRKSDLDSALLRPGRFDVEVLVPLPDLEGRKQILELYISKILSQDIDINKIAKATAGCTGADLEAMVNHAAIRAATDGAPYVTMSYLENAKDKIMIGPERKSALTNEEANLMTAYHEGGHTIVAYFTEGVGVVDKVTIVPRGESLGHTSVVPENDLKYITKAMCMAQMDIALGGRAAEELIYGVTKITANASDDLDKATAIASNMVKQFGMSEKIGLRTLKTSEKGLSAVNEYGQVIGDQIDLEVKRLVQESYDRAKSVLKKHAKEHKLLAEALVKYKTLSPEDVRAILGDNASEKSSMPSAVLVN